jgi:ankyrin repeat protein
MKKRYLCLLLALLPALTPLAPAQSEKTPAEVETDLSKWLDKNPDPSGLHEFTGFAELPAEARARLLKKVAKGLDANPQWLKAEVHAGVKRLDLAVFRGQPGVTDLLLKGGADASAPVLKYKNHFYLPLHLATGLARLPIYESGRPNVLEVVRLLIGAGAKVDAPDGEGRTAILGAVRGPKGVVELLLKHGASLKVRGKDGRTLLHVAAAAGSLEVVDLLLAKGLDPNLLDHRNRTALSQAGRVDVARRLLQAKVKLDHRDSDGMSALAHALWRDDLAVAEFLRKQGAKLDLHTAAALGDREAIARLATKATLKSLAHLATPLQWAVRAKQVGAASKLLGLGADPNLRDDLGLPLRRAVQVQSVALTKLLLAAGADPNLQAKPMTDAPVHFAARGRSLKILQAFGPYKPNMNLPGKWGRTPLHEIARDALLAEFVEFAVKHGADVNALDDSRTPPLYVAIMQGSPHNGPLISALVGAGADPTLRDGGGGKTCIEIAEWKGRKDVANLLRQAAAKK